MLWMENGMRERYGRVTMTMLRSESLGEPGWLDMEDMEDLEWMDGGQGRCARYGVLS